MHRNSREGDVNPLLDVVMTTFNENRSLLKKSLDSVLQQTYSNFRLILVLEPQDKNTDFIDEFSLNQRRIVVVKNQEKIGFVASLNKGVGLSTAKYIARLDTDDICHPERLSKQVEFLEENPDVDVLGSWIVYDEPATIIRKYPENHAEIKSSFLLSNAIAHPSVVLKRKLFEKFDCYNESFAYSEDLELWLRLLEKGCIFHNLQEPLLTYSVARRVKPRLDRVFIYRARLRHNRGIYRYIPAIVSILIYRILSLVPSDLFVLVKRIFAKKVGYLHKE